MNEKNTPPLYRDTTGVICYHDILNCNLSLSLKYKIVGLGFQHQPFIREGTEALPYNIITRNSTTNLILARGNFFTCNQALRRLSSRFNGIGGAIGVLSERAPKPWNQAFSSLSLSPYLVLPKAFALKNHCFQGFEVHRILEITNFMIEWGKNAGNIWAYFRVFWRNYIENLYFQNAFG